MEDTEAAHFKSVCAAFFNYQLDSLYTVARTERSFSSLSSAHAAKLKYSGEERVRRMKEAVEQNYRFLVHIVHPHRDLFTYSLLVTPTQPDGRLEFETLHVSFKDINKLKSTLRQVVRDWGVEVPAT
jgi:hypothetical protein